MLHLTFADNNARSKLLRACFVWIIQSSFDLDLEGDFLLSANVRIVT